MNAQTCNFDRCAHELSRYHTGADCACACHDNEPAGAQPKGVSAPTTFRSAHTEEQRAIATLGLIEVFTDALRIAGDRGLPKWHLVHRIGATADAAHQDANYVVGVMQRAGMVDVTCDDNVVLRRKESRE